MTAIVWDVLEERFIEHGVDHGVLYDYVDGAYVDGVAWNGLTAVTESPSGAEPNKQYADNIVYINLISAEEFSATIEAFMAPVQFDKHNGIYRSGNGVQYGQQRRSVFGFSWRSGKGTAVDEDAGYILHLAYGCQASPSEKNYSTKSDTPEPATFSWSLSTTPVSVPGRKPTAVLHIDTTDPSVDPANLADLEDILYGTEGVAPRLPLPAEVEAIMGAGVVTVTPDDPTFDTATDTITIPNDAGVVYTINGVEVPAGPVVINTPTKVKAMPDEGHTFTGVFVNEWVFRP